MPKLTDLTIKNAAPGFLWDDAVKGFGVRIGKNRKTFVVLVASGRRHRVGHYPTMSLAEARSEARKMLAEKTLGSIPPRHMAWDDAKGDYLAECAKKNRATTVSDYTSILANNFPFGRTGVADVTPYHIIHRLRLLESRPVQRRYAFAVARAFLKWCTRQHIIDRSPMENLQTPHVSPPRERVLTTAELRRLIPVLMADDATFKHITLLLLLTGQRRSEIARMEWGWVEKATVTIPSTVTKNRRTHTFPLGPWARQVIESIPQHVNKPYVFPAARQMKPTTTVFNGWSKPKAALDRESGITDWTLHDLRRTVSSGMAALGVPQVVVEKLLNHVSGGIQSPIAQVYNRHHYMREMTDAVLQWERHLATLE